MLVADSSATRDIVSTSRGRRRCRNRAGRERHSSDASQHTSAATSSTCPSRPIGIFDTM